MPWSAGKRCGRLTTPCNNSEYKTSENATTPKPARKALFKTLDRDICIHEKRTRRNVPQSQGTVTHNPTTDTTIPMVEPKILYSCKNQEPEGALGSQAM